MQMTKLARLLPALAAIATLAFVAGCGSGDDDGDTTAAGGAATTAATAPPDRPTGVDRAFAQQMVPHHEGAIAMAELAPERARSAFVRQLAADVISAQEAEIRVLEAADRRLAAAGVEPGDLGLSESEMGMDHDMAMLRDADDFDRAFVEMMIPHHEGAIAMAEVELAQGGDPELRALAQNVIDAQRGEIEAMREQLGIDGASETDADGGHSGH